MSSTKILEPTVAPLIRGKPHTSWPDWESPTGPIDAGVRPRTALPTFVYLGYGEKHWRGQTCPLIGAASLDERTVVFSCGCRASVPWWTLEPIANG